MNLGLPTMVVYGQPESYKNVIFSSLLCLQFIWLPSVLSGSSFINCTISICIRFGSFNAIMDGTNLLEVNQAYWNIDYEHLRKVLVLVVGTPTQTKVRSP